jgi:hypothetical protein
VAAFFSAGPYGYGYDAEKAWHGGDGGGGGGGAATERNVFGARGTFLGYASYKYMHEKRMFAKTGSGQTGKFSSREISFRRVAARRRRRH